MLNGNKRGRTYLFNDAHPIIVMGDRYFSIGVLLQQTRVEWFGWVEWLKSVNIRNRYTLK